MTIETLAESIVLLARLSVCLAGVAIVMTVKDLIAEAREARRIRNTEDGQ